MLFIIWVLIAMFSWILLQQLLELQLQLHEGFKLKKLGKSIAKTADKAATAVEKTADKATTAVTNKVGGAIAKVATSGMNKNTKLVLKNIKKIKQSIGSFIKKSGPYKPIPPPAIIPLVGRKCGI
jgi:anaerobic ribonucleoside-triphosphate reductase